MRTNGEAVSLTIGDATVKIGTAYAIIATKGSEGRTTTRLWFKPYWPGLMHATALIVGERKRATQKAK